MNPLLFVTPLLGMLSVIVLFMGIASMMTAQSEAIQGRLGAFRRESVVGGQASQDGSSAFVTGLNRVLERRSFAQTIADDLARADLKITVAEFLIISISVALGLGILLSIFLKNPVPILLTPLGYFIGRMFVKNRIGARRNTFNEQLGDALELLVNSLRAGASLKIAMEMVVREMPAPASTEFGRAVREMDLGSSTEEALNGLLERMPSDSLDLIVTVINISHEVGGNLPEILESIAMTIREREKLKGEVKAKTAQQSASSYLVSFLPIALGVFLWLVNPEYVGQLPAWYMNGIPCGWILLGIAGLMVMAGFFVIKQVTAIEL